MRVMTIPETAHVTGDEEYHAAIPFPVTIAPSRHVAFD